MGQSVRGETPHDAPVCHHSPHTPQEASQGCQERQGPRPAGARRQRVTSRPATAGAVTPGGQDGREVPGRGTGRPLTPPEPTAAENENGHTKWGASRGPPAWGRSRDVPRRRGLPSLDGPAGTPWPGGAEGRAWEGDTPLSWKADGAGPRLGPGAPRPALCDLCAPRQLQPRPAESSRFRRAAPPPRPPEGTLRVWFLPRTA